MIELLQETYDFNNEKYVSLREMLEHQEIKDNLTVPLGKEKNKYHYIGFEDIPCLFVTGETGSGKSVFLDSIIISLLLKNKSTDIKFVLIDPKKIELSYYKDLDYVAGDIINKGKESNQILSTIKEMYERRKILLKDMTLNQYNEQNNTKIFHLFVIIDESNETMRINSSLEILKEMIKDCDKVGIHFIIATNASNEKYFDKEFIDNMNYKITFDLTCVVEASWLGMRNSQHLQTPGEAIVKSIPQEIRLKLQTPYISDKDILTEINYLKNLSR